MAPLVDSEALHQRSWEIVLQQLGLPFQPEDYVQFFSGRPGRLICQERFGMSAEEALRTSDLVTEVYWELAAGRLAPLPGLTAFLDRLDGVGIAVATSARRRSALRMLRELALLGRFAAIVTADDVVHGKPHPEPFLTAAPRLGVPPGRCLAIEDSPAGLQAARAAGMTCVGLTTTHAILPRCASAH
ncbi:MAG: beta-phosphoglucomutase [Thermomicrobiales bacterium]|nr:MAG: beta-phosphoglucomutase [Thermomicrobiales bacterium]